MITGIYTNKGKNYKRWESIIRRCYNQNCKGYKFYGERGIKVCDRWLNNFENFHEDMGDCPIGMSLDRIDNNGNYCKENCRWATKKQQAQNRRSSRMITYKNETKCLKEWAEKFNIIRSTLDVRLNHGWDIEKALLTPINEISKQFRYFTINGETKNVRRWADEYNMPYKLVIKRIGEGWDIERALMTPKRYKKK